MIRKIIHIDQELCNGCGACANACHENAIGMVNGKAQLLRDDYCDGLGDCLPACPTGAITFKEREAASYDEAAVKANQAALREAAKQQEDSAERSEGCAASKLSSAEVARSSEGTAAVAGTAQAAAVSEPAAVQAAAASQPAATQPAAPEPATSQLHNWPIQIKLAPISAPAFADADLLIAADCTAYAYANFHQDFMAGKTLLMGCPKLDAVNYTDKLTQILAANSIRSVTLTRMEVPCCGGLEFALKNALEACGKTIPLKVATISIDGNILSVE